MEQVVGRVDTAQFEGIRLRRYFDTKGIPTIGIGMNLQRSDARRKLASLGYNIKSIMNGTQSITEEHARELFQEDLDKAESQARGLIRNFDDHPEEIQAVFRDLTFNLGKGGFSKFRNTRKAFERKDYAAAARGLRNSLWFRQVKSRGRKIVDIVRSYA